MKVATMERRIIKQIVTSALERGYKVSVGNGGDWYLLRSDHLGKIMCAVFACDEEVLQFSDADNLRVGNVWLVYGNDGYDVISDHTDNAAMGDLLVTANALAEALDLRVNS